MAGAEYQSYQYGIFPDNIYDQNVPCARCYTENRPATMMIPAKRTCPGGWTKEYEGEFPDSQCMYACLLSHIVDDEIYL